MKKFVALLTKEKGKTAINEWENNDSDIIRVLYSGYKKIGQFFFHTYLLSYLDKYTPNLLKAINIWTSSQVKLNINLLRILCICAQNLFIKL